MFTIVPFIEDVLLQMPVRGEIDGRERNISKETCARALVKTKETQLTDNVYSTLR